MMFGLKRAQITAAMTDLHDGIGNWRLWHLMAWQDIKQRYRRSTLGPIWLVLSMAVQILVMGIVFTYIFKSAYSRYLPYICAGLVFWTLITQVINEGAMAFITSTPYMSQIKRPFTIYLMQNVWRNVIILGHNFVVYIIVALVFLVEPSRSILLWPVGLFVNIVCVSWMALVVAIVSVRFRDVPMIVQSILTVMFWWTPLMYYPEQLGSLERIVEFNPFTHMLALVREPLLGQTPSLVNWLVALGMAVLGWGITILFFARFRARIAYWL